MLNNSFECNKITSYESLSKIQQAELDTFIKGLIQGALSIKNTFTVSDVVGGRFTDWSNTPLDYIYQYHKNRNCANPENESGKDIGRIFKYVMAKDKNRKYEIVGTQQRQFPINVYKMI